MSKCAVLRTLENGHICSITIVGDENIATMLKKFKSVRNLSKLDVRFVAGESCLQLEQHLAEDFVKHVGDKQNVGGLGHSSRDMWPGKVLNFRSNLSFPVNFVIVEGPDSGRVLRTDDATTTTTVQQMMQWISGETKNSDWDAVSFFFSDYGKSQCFPRNEELCDALKNEAWYM